MVMEKKKPLVDMIILKVDMNYVLIAFFKYTMTELFKALLVVTQIAKYSLIRCLFMIIILMKYTLQIVVDI